MSDPQSYVFSPRSSQTAYDLAAPFYDNWKWQKFWRQYEYPIIRNKIEQVARHTSSEISILDLGCGTGWYLNSFLNISSDIHGVDISEGMLKIARGRIGPNRVTLGDIRSVNLVPNRYDIIILTRVLSHIEDISNLFENIFSSIRPFGVVIISDIDPLHNYKFTKLPYFDKSIFAETFKHERDVIDKNLNLRGFTFESGYSIGMDGHRAQILNAKDQTKLPDPAGWVGTWRQFRKKRTKPGGFRIGRKAMSISNRGTIGLDQ